MNVLEQQQDSISLGKSGVPSHSASAHTRSFGESGSDSRSSTTSPVGISPQLPGSQRGGEESVDYDGAWCVSVSFARCIVLTVVWYNMPSLCALMYARYVSVCGVVLCAVRV